MIGWFEDKPRLELIVGNITAKDAAVSRKKIESPAGWPGEVWGRVSTSFFRRYFLSINLLTHFPAPDKMETSKLMK
jgi:hypothetical protein